MAGPPVRVVLVDNHDSYTFNLAASLRVAGAEVEVLANDDDRVRDLDPSTVDAVVISPGPGNPTHPGDVGHLAGLLDRFTDRPILGVCLGHQLLAVHAGSVIAAIEPHHGHLSPIEHDGTGPFAGLPSPFTATRYHSLAVVPTEGVRVNAWSEDDVVMGLEVLGRPWWGVQFHPESVATEYGDQLVATFLDSVRTERR